MELDKKQIQFKVLGLYLSNSLNVSDVVDDFKIKNEEFNLDLTDDEKYYAKNFLTLKIEDIEQKNKMITNVIQVMGELSFIQSIEDDTSNKDLIEKLQEVISYLQI
jgi:hypothetical protein